MTRKKKQHVWIAIGVLALIGVVIFLYRPDAGPDYRIPTLEYGVTDAVFERSFAGVIGCAPVGGNEIRSLHNGDDIFPAMLEAIRGARHSVNFETYVFWPGDVARDFVAAMADRARSGVDVNVIVDAVGGQAMSEAQVEQLKSAGADVHFFNEPSFLERDAIATTNCRTHRKLLVVDGRVGFLGGVGIGDDWLGDARGPGEWRDAHFRVEGPVVASLQSAFSENWCEMAGELLHGPSHYPPLEARGPHRALVVHSSPEGESGDVQKMFLLAIAGARKSIRIATPYFVPDDLTLEQLVRARKRGVAVDLIVAGPHTDMPITRSASRRLWGELLAAGVRIHEYRTTMFHCKYMIVDDEWTSIGSANFDNRSFKLNDEANLIVIDRAFGAELGHTFVADLEHCEPVTLAAWRDRPWDTRLRESVAALFREHL